MSVFPEILESNDLFNLKRNEEDSHESGKRNKFSLKNYNNKISSLKGSLKTSHLSGISLLCLRPVKWLSSLCRELSTN